MEIVCELEKEARERLYRLGYGTVRTKCADGWQGWSKEAPFGAIVLTAATGTVPPPLLEQLKDGGRLVAPLGDSLPQSLVRLRRRGKEFQQEELLPVAFVPMTGEALRRR